MCWLIGSIRLFWVDAVFPLVCRVLNLIQSLQGVVMRINSFKYGWFCLLVSMLLFNCLGRERLFGQHELGWRDLAERHQNSVDKIYAMKTELFVDRLITNSEQLGKPSPIRRVLWAFDKTKILDRQRGWLLSLPQPNDQEEAVNCYDILQTSEGCRWILNWDWDRPRNINPPNQGSIRAYFGRPEDLLRGSAIYPECSMLFSIQVDNADSPRSIAEFLSTSADVKVDIVTHEGRKVYSVTAKHPEFDNKGSFYSGVNVECLFDESVGYMLRNLKVFLPKTAGEKNGWINELSVTRYESREGGMFLPEEVMLTYQSDDAKLISFKERIKISNTLLNEEVSPDEFILSFPENALVVNAEVQEDSNGDKFQMFLWGPNDQPAHELESAKELGNYAQPSKSVYSMSPSTRFLFTLLNVLFLLGLAILWLRSTRRLFAK